MQLTEHFADTEEGLTILAGADPRIVANVVYLLEQVLEPVRNHFNAPVDVHCSYRPPAHNAAVGGKPTSYHLCDGGKSAIDFGVQGIAYGDVFDWIRLESGLPFDKVILESDANSVPACVHVQADRFNAPRRLAEIGETGAGTVYISVEVK